jgi:hypothetical protein
MDPRDPRPEPQKRPWPGGIEVGNGRSAEIYVPSSEPHWHTKNAFWLIGP